MSHLELFMVRAKCGVPNVREALVTHDVDDGVEGGWKVWKEWYVLLINCVGMLRLQIGSIFESFRLLKLPKANLLFCHF